MKGYLIANVRVDDPERFRQEYKPAAQAALERFGGRVLVSDSEAEEVEGTWKLDRVAVIEFDDLARARAYLASPEYAAAKERREGVGHWDISILHGYEDGRPDVLGEDPAYLVGNTELRDDEGIRRHLTEWAPRAHPALERNGGKVIAISRSEMVISTSKQSGPPYPQGGAEPPELIEGDWKLQRVLLHRYPSIDHARAFVTSEEWVGGAHIREGAGRYDVILLRSARASSDSLL